MGQTGIVGDSLRLVACIVVLVAGVWVCTYPLPSYAETSFVEAVKNAPASMVNWPQNDTTYRLLHRYKPRIYVAPNSFMPVSFYRDYLPKTVLKNRSGDIVSDTVDRALLQRYKDNPSHYLDYRLSSSEALNANTNEITPTLYGRIYADTLSLRNIKVPLLFLKYSPVFPYSGLPYGNGWFKQMGSHMIGEPWAWHELDIHGAIHVILHRHTKKPVGLLLAQHNHHQLLLRKRDFNWPEGNRVQISFAVRSNEPYLITEQKGTRLEPTIGNPSDIPALFGRTWIRPMSAGYDRILAPKQGASAVKTTLKLLPPDDPLNVSRMELGDQRKLLWFWSTFFREGPPGMDYYAHPGLKNLADLTAFWNIDPGDDRFFQLLEKHPRSLENYNFEPILRHQKQSLLADLRRFDLINNGSVSESNPE
ncbi:MAG: hypothetical protein ABEK50_07255 [bacterium]